MLRTKHLCNLPITKTKKIGMQSLSFRGISLWNNLNDEIKELPTVASIKTKIKPGWVNNVIVEFVNSLAAISCNLQYYFLDILVNYIVNRWYISISFLQLCHTNFKE